MDKYFDIKNKVLEYANNDENIKAIIAIGSSTRTYMKADEFSDLDLFIITSNTEEWFCGDYPKLLGTINISFIEDTLGGGRERRCIYDDDKDVDMIILTPEQFEKAVADGVAEWVMNRGYDVLYDSNGYTELLKTHIKSGSSEPAINEEEFINIVNDFYFHNIWACKKLKRGELWSAKTCVDSYLKNYLLRMMELYRYKIAGVDVWHAGRFVERWAGDEIVNDLKMCFAHYDKEDIMRALVATHKLFARITEALAAHEGFEYPEQAKICAGKYIGVF